MILLLEKCCPIVLTIGPHSLERLCISVLPTLLKPWCLFIFFKLFHIPINKILSLIPSSIPLLQHLPPPSCGPIPSSNLNIHSPLPPDLAAMASSSGIASGPPTQAFRTNPIDTNPRPIQMTTELMRRPEFGKAGKPATIAINSHIVRKIPIRSVFQYDVSYRSPPSYCSSVAKLLLGLHRFWC